jgi:hypothetical protein
MVANGLALLLLSPAGALVSPRLSVVPAARGCARVHAKPTMSLVRDGFLLAVLGDLHMEDDMSAHEEAREDCLEALRGLSLLDGGRVAALRARPAGELSLVDLELLVDTARAGELLDAHVVSLGDLGRKDIRNEPGDAGTSLCFEEAKAYFDGFAPLPLSIVTGNHDLEGLSEFETDEANLEAWLKAFGLDTPYWSKQARRRAAAARDLAPCRACRPAGPADDRSLLDGRDGSDRTPLQLGVVCLCHRQCETPDCVPQVAARTERRCSWASCVSAIASARHQIAFRRLRLGPGLTPGSAHVPSSHLRTHRSRAARCSSACRRRGSATRRSRRTRFSSPTSRLVGSSGRSRRTRLRRGGAC